MIEEKMTGIVDGYSNKVLFCSDGYQFTFMTSELPSKNQREGIVIHPVDGYVFATTHTGKKVAILVGIHEFEVLSSISLSTELFLVSDLANPNVDIARFRSIAIVGGTLNKLRDYKSKGISTKYSDDNCLTVNRTENRSSYTFSTESFSCKVTVGNVARDHGGLDDLTLKDDRFLLLTFDKDQPIGTFLKHYRHINRLVSVMTNRSENPCSEIILSPSVNDPQHYLKKVYVYLKDNQNQMSQNNTCISFEEMGSSIANLLSLFYNSKPKKPSYSLGFIPRNDDESWQVTDDVVRSVSSALECEADLDDDVKRFQQSELTKLCSTVKDVVVRHREEHASNPVLTDATYDLIFGSINHWSSSAFDRITILFHKHEKAIHFLPCMYYIDITDADIHAFISYRNSISHGTYREMTGQIRRTTLVLGILVRCCILYRVGVPEKTIKDICCRYFGF